jgi:hypothetical protein
MKKLFLLIGLLLGGVLMGQQIIVFSKGEFVLVDSQAAAPVPRDPAKAAFLAACQADLVRPAAFAEPLPLIAPPEWGKTVPGAAGKITFHDKFPGGFFVQVALDGLAPGHRYILTLNGNPKLAGNERLVDPVPGMKAERYFDFFTITTDKHGRYDVPFGIALLPGPYDVRFYVKDTDDFKIVLYHDYFKFAVE